MSIIKYGYKSLKYLLLKVKKLILFLWYFAPPYSSSFIQIMLCYCCHSYLKLRLIAYFLFLTIMNSEVTASIIKILEAAQDIKINNVLLMNL